MFHQRYRHFHQEFDAFIGKRQSIFVKHESREFAVLEGVMGLFDGLAVREEDLLIICLSDKAPLYGVDAKGWDVLSFH